MVKAGKQTRNDVNYHTGAAKNTQEAVDALVKKTDKKTRDESYKDVLAFPENCNVSLFKNKNYQVFVFIGINSSQWHRIICLFHTGGVPTLIQADVLDTS